MAHNKEVYEVFDRACKVLRLSGFIFRPMMIRTRSQGHRTKRHYVLGRINLKIKTVTIDIYTVKRRKPKRISALLSVIAHELAHYQKPPYRQWHRGRLINRMHYPVFYRQVKRNMQKFKKDTFLKCYFGARGGT